MRVGVGDHELERVLGGGIVPGSVILMAGEPGAGKSTLLLQMAAHPGLKMFVHLRQESGSQIKMRAQRLGIKGSIVISLPKQTSTGSSSPYRIFQAGIVIIDSIQTMYSADLESVPGSVSQIRECSYRLQQLSKTDRNHNCACGPHHEGRGYCRAQVDGAYRRRRPSPEGDRNTIFRLLRCVKNRFGSTREIGIYEMKGGRTCPCGKSIRMADSCRSPIQYVRILHSPGLRRLQAFSD